MKCNETIYRSKNIPSRLDVVRVKKIWEWWRVRLAVAVETPWFAAYLLKRFYELMKALRPSKQLVTSTITGATLAVMVAVPVAQAGTIAVGGGCTLREAIQSANTNSAIGGCTNGSGADTITLPANGTLTYSTGPYTAYGDNALPSITSTITIEGNNSTIETDGTPDFRFFHVSDSNGQLTLNQVTLQGANLSLFSANPDGGAIFNQGELIIQSSTISGNSAFLGGGIFNLDTNAKTMLQDSTVIYNNATIGGGVTNISGTITIQNSTVITNDADHGGGIGNKDGMVTVQDNSLITGNYACGRGGGIDNLDGTVTINDSTISYNEACTYGGGIYAIADGVGKQSNVTINNSTISGNFTYNREGGGIYNRGVDNGIAEMIINDSTISGNYAYEDGGGVYNRGDDNGIAKMTLNHTTISGNTTNDDGGGIYNYGYNGGTAEMTLNHTTISGNTANGDGGGIYNYGNNGATVEMTINNSLITGNNALYDGGGITNDDDGTSTTTMTINQSTIANNYAGSDGGGIENDSNNNKALLIINNSTISGNEAVTYGGGLHNEKARSRLYNVTVTGNKARDGGGIYNEDAVIQVNNSIVVGNTASNGRDVKDNGSAFTSNQFNVIGVDSSTTSDFANDITGVAVSDVLETSLANNGGDTPTHVLRPNSPAINAGRNADVVGTVDQRGYPRITNDVVDIGAVETNSVGGVAEYIDTYDISSVWFENLTRFIKTGVMGLITALGGLWFITKRFSNRL